MSKPELSTDSLDQLLEKLNQGDEAAAQEIFLAYQPYLRMVVRRQLSTPLRTKFDSMDVVQSVWADVLNGFREGDWHFADAAHLRAFLAKVTRNRLIDRARQHSAAVEHEQPLEATDTEFSSPARDPKPSEVFQAVELWEQMLALCPPTHHSILRLRRQGKTLSEIAAQTGLHEGSVRRILYDLARRLSHQQDDTLAVAPPGNG